MTAPALLEMDLHIKNDWFPTMFTLIKFDDINGDLKFLYGLELLIPSSGTGTRSCDI